MDVGRSIGTARIVEFSFSGDPVDRVLSSIDPADEVFVVERWDPKSRGPEVSYVGFANKIEKVEKSSTHDSRLDEFDMLREILDSKRIEVQNGTAGLSGGVFAFYSYESLTEASDEGVGPRAMLMQPTLMLVFDHKKSKAYAVIVDASQTSEQRADEIVERLKSMCLSQSTSQENGGLEEPVWTPAVTEAEFAEFAATAIERMNHESELDGVVLSVQCKTTTDIPPVPSYRWLRRIDPSTYMFLATSTGFSVWGATSLTLARLKGDTLTVETDGATRPMEKTADGSPFVWIPNAKEIDEYDVVLNALVDDLTPIVDAGSLHFTAEFEQRRFFDLLHLFAEAEAEVKQDVGPVDVMRALSPHGAAVGFTRKRALETIRELEPIARGPFSGSMGFFGFDGSLESSTVTRSMWKTVDASFVHAGAKVVAASDPAAEYRECILKTKALRDCARLALVEGTASLEKS